MNRTGRVLFRSSNRYLFITLSVLPARIAFRDQTFCQVLQALRDGVEFKRRARLLVSAERSECYPDGVAHKLLQKGSLNGLRADAKKAGRLFDRIFSIYDDAYDYYRVTCHGIAKDVHEI